MTKTMFAKLMLIIGLIIMATILIWENGLILGLVGFFITSCVAVGLTMLLTFIMNKLPDED